MTKDRIKFLRAIKRQRFINANNMAGYRMVGKTIPPKRGKGARYKRKNKHTNEGES